MWGRGEECFTLAADSKPCARPPLIPVPDFQRFAGIDRLYGVGAARQLAGSRVAVVGVGGVGSWLVEALARSGVGHLRLIDADDVCESNVNRQLQAIEGSFGKSKVALLADRVAAINPDARVEPVAQMLTAGNLEALLGEGIDLVLDACDSFRTKVELIAWCRRRKLPVIVSGSAGGRTDPTQVRVRDLSRTEHDALLALIRKKLRQDFGFPKNTDRYFGVPAAYSLENVRYPQADGSVCGTRPAHGADAGFKLDCGAGLGAATHLTGSFAFAMAGRAIPMLLAGTAKRALQGE